jgi:hypothetical protein
MSSEKEPIHMDEYAPPASSPLGHRPLGKHDLDGWTGGKNGCRRRCVNKLRVLYIPRANPPINLQYREMISPHITPVHIPPLFTHRLRHPFFPPVHHLRHTFPTCHPKRNRFTWTSTPLRRPLHSDTVRSGNTTFHHTNLSMPSAFAKLKSNQGSQARTSIFASSGSTTSRPSL